MVEVYALLRWRIQNVDDDPYVQSISMKEGQAMRNLKVLKLPLVTVLISQ